jgi:hypothetical protein
MRECPNCGMIDPPIWRPRIFDPEVDFCQLKDLDSWDPILYAMMKSSKAKITVELGKYAYKKTGTGYVWRMWGPLFAVRGWSPKAYYDSAGSKKSASLKAFASARYRASKKIRQERLD